MKNLQKLFFFVILISLLFSAPLFMMSCTETTNVSKNQPSYTEKALSSDKTQEKDDKAAEDNAETPESTEDQAESESANYEEALVTRVIDGDTIVVLISGREEKVRLIGIDTPEKGRPYYTEATKKTAELVLGKKVKLVKDVSERDRYGRLLRYVYVGNLFVNAELVRLGFAMAYTYPPDVKYADYFVRLQREARENMRGLWAVEEKKNETNKSTTYVASKRSNVFHYPWCEYAKKIAPYNLITFKSREEAVNSGRRPCRVCNP